MRDHKSGRPELSKKIVGVRELKTHAARIVRQVREARASYIVTHRGRAVGMILPLEPPEETSATAEDASAAWGAFERAGRRLERRFRPGLSGVRLLSAMRR
jgi:prevent-host-death family protein